MNDRNTCIDQEIYLVQVPAPRGSFIPEIASIKDDLPELWEPITAMSGIFRSPMSCTLVEGRDRYYWGIPREIG